MERKNITSFVVIDLSAAFDTVDHSILLEVLKKKFGLGSVVLNWFSDYLSNRKCKVNIGSQYSRDIDLNFSVPQGSCAGPVLYLAYASTLQEAVFSNIQLHGFADDHDLKNEFPAGDINAEASTLASMEACLTNVKNWMDENRLKMNDTKTEFISFAVQPGSYQSAHRILSA
jgi:hypothetical protein